MIDEKHIDNYLQKLEQKESDNSFLDEETLLDYLKSDTFNSLSGPEKKILFFCFEVIFYSYTSAKNEPPVFDIEDYIDAEEDNWKVREDHDNWQTTIDAFFKDYEEEDLLAFLEDTLVDDDEDELSEIAKEVIFISCKSYIDSITGS